MLVPGPENPGCVDLQDIDSTVSISNLLRNHFRILGVLNGIECSTKVFLSHFSHKMHVPSRYFARCVHRTSPCPCVRASVRLVCVFSILSYVRMQSSAFSPLEASP
jgi:hypothetical protein